MLRKTIASLFVLGAVAAAPVTAHATPLKYLFEQTGFSEGASVTGSFIGEDLNSNGEVSLADGEVYDFKLQFSGNSLVDAFTLVFTDLAFLAYNLDGVIGDVFDFEGIDAFNSGFQYAGGPDVFFTECGIGFDCAFVAGPTFDDYSAELISVDVPEPATAMLLLTGLLGTGLLMQRRKA